MSQRYLIFQSAEDLRKGDLFVSCFSIKGSEYPVAKTILDIVDSGDIVALFFEGGGYAKIMKGMKIITQDKTPMADPMKGEVDQLKVHAEIDEFLEAGPRSPVSEDRRTKDAILERLEYHYNMGDIDKEVWTTLADLIDSLVSEDECKGVYCSHCGYPLPEHKAWCKEGE